MSGMTVADREGSRERAQKWLAAAVAVSIAGVCGWLRGLGSEIRGEPLRALHVFGTLGAVLVAYQALETYVRPIAKTANLEERALTAEGRIVDAERRSARLEAGMTEKAQTIAALEVDIAKRSDDLTHVEGLLASARDRLTAAAAQLALVRRNEALRDARMLEAQILAFALTLGECELEMMTGSALFSAISLYRATPGGLAGDEIRLNLPVSRDPRECQLDRKRTAKTAQLGDVYRDRPGADLFPLARVRQWDQTGLEAIDSALSAIDPTMHGIAAQIPRWKTAMESLAGVHSDVLNARLGYVRETFAPIANRVRTQLTLADWGGQRMKDLEMEFRRMMALEQQRIIAAHRNFVAAVEDIVARMPDAGAASKD